MFIRDVVSQLEFMKRNRLGHPLLAGGRAVRVDVHPFGHLRVGLACHHPAGVVELVAAVVCRHDVHQQDVFGFFIKPVYSHFERRKHSPKEIQTHTHTHTQSQHGAIAPKHIRIGCEAKGQKYIFMQVVAGNLATAGNTSRECVCVRACARDVCRTVCRPSPHYNAEQYIYDTAALRCCFLK